MRFLANENVPGPVVRLLREMGRELAFRSGLPATCGVVLLRIPWTDPIADNVFVVSALTGRDDGTGVFAVIEHDRVRLRPLPTRTEES